MIRVVHTLGGCGGTLLSRCLAVLPGAALLSEINPASVKLYKHFCPLYQDLNWLHVLDEAEHARFSAVDLGDSDQFCALIQTFHSRAKASGRHLILRDFNYIEFVGLPFNQTPPRRLTIYDSLPQDIPTKAVAFIRHPIDQWVSLCKHVELLPLDPVHFCDSYAEFLKGLGSIPIYKYEDFVEAPHKQMQAICSDLDLPFDSSCFDRFCDYASLTGDLTRVGEKSISLPKRTQVASETLESFRSSRSYQNILDETGYPNLLEELVSMQ